MNAGNIIASDGVSPSSINCRHKNPQLIDQMIVKQSSSLIGQEQECQALIGWSSPGPGQGMAAANKKEGSSWCGKSWVLPDAASW